MNRTISIPKQCDDKLVKEKKETGLTISEIIRRALDNYFHERSKA